MASIVHLSEGANLALHATMRLAQQPGQLQDTRSLANAIGASVAHMSKVLQRLHKAGYLQTVRGPAGGFRLARDPARVTLLAIYEAVEGPLEIRSCLLERPAACPGHCLFRDFLRSTGERFRDMMAGTTLADVVRDTPAPDPVPGKRSGRRLPAGAAA